MDTVLSFNEIRDELVDVSDELKQLLAVELDEVLDARMNKFRQRYDHHAIKFASCVHDFVEIIDQEEQLNQLEGQLLPRGDVTMCDWLLEMRTELDSKIIEVFLEAKDPRGSRRNAQYIRRFADKLKIEREQWNRRCRQLVLIIATIDIAIADIDWYAARDDLEFIGDKYDELLQYMRAVTFPNPI